MLDSRNSDRRREAPQGGAIKLLDVWHSDRRREAPEEGAINLADLRHPNGRIVPFGFFVPQKRGR